MHAPTHTRYLPGSVTAFFYRKWRRGRVRERRGVSVWDHVFWPVYRDHFSWGAMIQNRKGRRGARGRWRGMTELCKEENRIQRQKIVWKGMKTEQHTTQQFPLKHNTHLVLQGLGAVAARTGVYLRGSIGQGGHSDGLRVPPKLWVKLIDFTDCDITLESIVEKRTTGNGWSTARNESAVFRFGGKPEN